MICEFCNRTVKEITKHHLIPKTTHSKKKIKNRFSKEKRQETVNVCHDCHKTFHKFYSEMQLALEYNTLELLGYQEDLKRYKLWIVKQREGIV
jgi:protein-arginine kinase activator protein McsA